MNSVQSFRPWQIVGFIFICVLIILPWCPPSFADEGDEVITHTASPDGLVEEWNVICPNVKLPLVLYPNIRFHKGDKIMIQSGGCVQTGSGRKRYVNPSGPNSDRFYFGQILIPGVTPSLQRISSYINKSYTIPQDSFLHLGYADNRYDDNGYYHPDDGTENQCRGEYAAYVKITIQRVPTGPGSPVGYCMSPNLKFVAPANGMSTRCNSPNCPPITLKWTHKNLPQPQFRTVKISVNDFHTGKTQVFTNIPLGQNGNGQFNLTNLRPSGNSHYSVKIECEQSSSVCNFVNFNLSYMYMPMHAPGGKSCSADDIKYNRNGCGQTTTGGAMVPMVR
jgi:hypothetical protein